MASNDHDRAAGSSPGEPPGQGDADLNFSRRNFLKSVGVGPLAAGVLATQASSVATAATLGPGEVSITLNVNGRTHTLAVEPRVTLLDALRTRLDITGQKRVCDRGSCGACTMLVDGRAVYACSMLAVEAQGTSIKTVEGLADGTVLHPVQQALCDTDGTMCGFCTPGFVVSMVALLEKVPDPTPEQARKALDGNVCRCGTYPRVLEAALKAGKGASRG
jgi:xanthine dehydrogenase YagT iron-sulfur-binding subunit